MATLRAEDQTNRIILITGGNAGLGFANAQALLEKQTPYTIILASRSVERGQRAAQTLLADPAYERAVVQQGAKVEVVQLDLEDEGSIDRAADEVERRFGRLNVLINNAGVNLDYAVASGSLTVQEAFTRSFHINVTAPYILTSRLIPLLLRSRKAHNPRIVFISSGISSLTEHSDTSIPLNLPPSAGAKSWPKPSARPDEQGPGIPNCMTYRSSKTAGNMMALEVERLVRNDGMKVLVVDPGLLATGLGGKEVEEAKKGGAKDPIEGGRLVRDVIEGERDGEVGKLISTDGPMAW